MKKKIFLLLLMITIGITAKGLTLDAAQVYRSFESMPIPQIEGLGERKICLIGNSENGEYLFEERDQTRQGTYYEGTAVYEFEKVLLAPLVKGNFFTLSKGMEYTETFEVEKNISKYYGKTISQVYQERFGIQFGFKTVWKGVTENTTIEEEPSLNCSLENYQEYQYSTTTELHQTVKKEISIKYDEEEPAMVCFQETALFKVFLYYNFHYIHNEIGLFDNFYFDSYYLGVHMLYPTPTQSIEEFAYYRWDGERFVYDIYDSRNYFNVNNTNITTPENVYFI